MTAEEFLRNSSKVTSYDLVILDINLTGINGLSALEKMKAMPGADSVPVLLLSGDSRALTVIAGMKLGAQDFLTKPIDPDLFIERVNALLEH
jgi:DNA-binding response OmpR family regulator